MENKTCPICHTIDVPEMKSCRSCTRHVCMDCCPRKVCFDGVTETRRCCNDCVAKIETETIQEFKKNLTEDLAQAVSDEQCVRFLRARNLNMQDSVRMITNWWTWWNSPLLGTDSTLPKNILRDAIEDPKEDLYTQICPHCFIGEDKEGRPIYWEQTGIISANFDSLKKNIRDEDELIVRHVRFNELNNIRYEYLSKKYNKNVTKVNIVFDMKGINMMPDFMGIKFVRKMLEVDQNYYPERLHKLFMINAPWFFTTIYALISPWVDPVTAKKINIIGSDYLATLREHIDDSNIPVELGGTLANIAWHWPYPESSGISPKQIAEYVERNKNAEN